MDGPFCSGALSGAMEKEWEYNLVCLDIIIVIGIVRVSAREKVRNDHSCHPSQFL
jgi:hypothetical protein